MQYIHFIGGRNLKGKTVAVAMGVSSDPEGQLTSLEGSSPFELSLLALEEGDAERLEQLKERFKGSHARGPWFQATDELLAYVEALEPVDREAGKTKRVSVDLAAEDFALLESLVSEMGIRSKAEFFRKGLRLYAGLHRYKAQGYLIQAVRGGKMVQFPDLDHIAKP